MKTKNNFSNKNLNGFTLIELIVVIAIIGILASIVYNPIINSLRKGRDAKRVSEMKSIQNALFNFYDSYGQYPVSLKNLSASSSFKLPKLATDTSSASLTFYIYSTTTSTNGKIKSFGLKTALETKHTAFETASNTRSSATDDICGNNYPNENNCLYELNENTY